jgi:hypothetical protein
MRVSSAQSFSESKAQCNTSLFATSADNLLPRLLWLKGWLKVGDCQGRGFFVFTKNGRRGDGVLFSQVGGY